MAELFDSGAMPEDPLVSLSFALEINGVLSGYFTEIAGLGSETQVVEMQHTLPDGKVVIRKVPGTEKWQDVTLKRGITSDMQLWEWRQQVVDGDIDGARSPGTITMYKTNGEAVARWNFANAWPSKITGPSLKSDDNSFGVEEIVMVHEGMWRDT
jgi:phage tail-like protein